MHGARITSIRLLFVAASCCALHLVPAVVSGFVPSHSHHVVPSSTDHVPTTVHLDNFHRHWNNYPTKANSFSAPSKSVGNTALLAVSSNDETLFFWIIAFASSHIGMSAIRTNIIHILGEIANNLNLIGNENWTLPDWWPGDGSGGNKFFPDADTAGRQIYRALYTAVSFITLGSAFGVYLQSASQTIATTVTAADSLSLQNACLAISALSLGASIASLFNASPLGLMPSFEKNSSTDENDAGSTLAGIRRDDAIKFSTRGLTRVTRHPLILPVVPWGFATAYLAGGRVCDYLLFGGLSIYAMAGCAAQDLRVMREEGSVGTVFRVNELSEERQQLKNFFEETSFVPFKAVLDGRQRLEDIGREFPWFQFIAGTILGVYLEEKILQILQDWSTGV